MEAQLKRALFWKLLATDCTALAVPYGNLHKDMEY